ncbi:LysM peptidoglycan-binding domain-containing protein [Uliginosibacterium sp. H3]|uniref:LysM peptidoglycan-binding domain-containing protein n=1 Tax=Uliginosibacterium silvisoli TaxID=3114758 RepID=A0ABU6K430_9RHOO|nr:LysM peptidoglycan-binding domain-containing protein [Uliginosibacterium sp. H3]
MTTFVKATYHPEIKTAEFIADNGRHLLRTGGSLPWRTNNGGNLVSPMTDGIPSPKKTKGYIGFAKAGVSNHHFFIFPDYETGREQLKASLLRKYSDKTLSETINLYAPANDNNDTERYINDLSKISGVSSDTKIKDVNAKQLEAVMDGIEQIEGYHADANTRKEVWVDVTQIQATDGARPIAGEKIVVKKDGKESTLTSNAVGQFPPIVHGKSPIEVQHKTVDGKTKSLGQLPADSGQHWSLLTKVTEFFGKTAPVKPVQAAITKKQPLLYTVQPGDSLSKISDKFKISVEQLKQDNQLKRDLILAGQVLGINGPAPTAPATTSPKTAVPQTPANSAKVKTDSPKPSTKLAPTAQNKTVTARTKKGEGEPIALITPEDGVVPWMKYAVAEAKKWRGKLEGEIEKTTNYHKDVHDGQQTMSLTVKKQKNKDGKEIAIEDHHPWCAAFANWCLMKAGYPIDNTNFYDHQAAKGRAHGFYEVKGEKASPKDKDAPTVRNPLFVQIKNPVYGAIAMVTGRSGRGHHVGFVYARNGDDELVLLGGNQKDTVKFSNYVMIARKAEKVKLPDGRTKVLRESSDHLVYFIPAAYVATNEKNGSKPELEDTTAQALNKLFEIVDDEKKAETRL